MMVLRRIYQNKICYIFFAIVFLLTNVAVASNANNSLQDGQFYFLMDADTKEILLAKNADVRIPPSSMTKLMTAYVVFDQVKKGKVSLENQCLIGKDAWRKSGSSMFLNYGDVVSVEDLVKGLLAVSGNDAAIALAESTANGKENFVRLMNLKARELGMTNSNFKNPHGLYEEGHYMSLRDLATLASRLYSDFPEYAHYFAIPEFTYRNITQQNRNPLIKNKYDGVVGGKTGHTNQGGYGVVGVVKRDNRRLIAVVNKAKTPRQRAQMITSLMDFGFMHYKKLTVFEKGQVVSQANTWLGKKDQVDVVVDREISFNVPQEKSLDSVNVSVKYKGPIYAPIKEGQKIAKLIVDIKGYKSFEYDLIAKERVDKAGYLSRISQIMRYKARNFFNKIL